MKVGLIAPGFSSDAGDWCIPVLVDVARELGRRAEVHVFALRYPHRCDRYRVHGVEVHALGGADVRGLRRLGLLAAIWPRVLAEHRHAPFTVLHGLWVDEPGFSAVATARVLRTPCVVSVMGGELVELPDIRYGGRLSTVNRLLTAVSLVGANRVTAGSGPAVELAHWTGRSSRGRRGERREVQRLVWGVDPCLFSAEGPARALAGEKRVLHVGSLVPVKDQITLLRAMARVHEDHPGIHLHIVGDGPLRPHLVQEAERLGLSGSVTFHGHIERRELASFYRAADLLVISSLHEAESAVVLEAMLCGTPVVGTAVGLVGDLAPRGACTVPIGDPRALADAMCAALQGPRAARRGEACSLSPGEVTAAHTAERLMAMYAELSAGKKGGERYG